MKKIIVPVDFSDCSRNALKNAIRIAERMHMELLLYHSVIIPVGFAEGAPIGSVGYDFEEFEQDAHEQLNTLVKDFPRLEKVPHSTMVRFGSLYESINEVCKDHEVAMIIMGSQGASGIARTLIGSNAYHVMKHVDIPIIAIPDGRDIGNMKHIALAGDYQSVPNHDVIRLVVELAKATFSQVHIIHIDQGEIMVNAQVNIARSMEKYLKHVNHSFHFRIFDDIEKGLVSFAEELNIDLLVMISKHHNLFERLKKGSHTRKMMLNIPMPLMVLHE